MRLTFALRRHFCWLLGHEWFNWSEAHRSCILCVRDECRDLHTGKWRLRGLTWIERLALVRKNHAR